MFYGLDPLMDCSLALTLTFCPSSFMCLCALLCACEHLTLCERESVRAVLIEHSLPLHATQKGVAFICAAPLCIHQTVIYGKTTTGKLSLSLKLELMQAKAVFVVT